MSTPRFTRVHQSEIKKVLFKGDTEASVYGVGSIVLTEGGYVGKIFSADGAFAMLEEPSIVDVNTLLGKSGVMLNIAVSGGGVTGISDLFTESGCSAFIDTFYVPYSMASFDRLTDRTPGSDWKYVSEVAAVRMASAMLNLGNTMTGKTLVGIGVSAKLAVPGERQGREHKMHMAVRFTKNGQSESRTFETIPEAGPRADQEQYLAQYIRAVLLRIPSFLE